MSQSTGAPDGQSPRWCAPQFTVMEPLFHTCEPEQYWICHALSPWTNYSHCACVWCSECRVTVVAL